MVRKGLCPYLPWVKLLLLLLVASAVPDSVRPHRWKPTRVPPKIRALLPSSTASPAKRAHEPGKLFTRP